MKGPLVIDFESLWQEGMHDWHGKMPQRMVDDALEEAFWTQSIAKKTLRQTDAYAAEIFQVIQQHITSEDSVLEIGPGWGNYTFPLVEAAKKVTCVDSSQSVLAYLQNCLQDKPDVDYVHAKWEEAAESSIGPHDIVIGVNCFYRMYHMKAALVQMNRLANKKAIIGMTTGPIQPHYEVLEERYGYDIKYPRRDYIELVNMLYQLGIFADCQMIPLERVYRYDSEEALLAAQSKKILSEQVDLAHVRDALTTFIERDGEAYVYRHRFYAAIISWSPAKTGSE
ncbi:class I SAM-dependent methyltransferase [Solibacillus sp. FSL H8-0538]|uniref:class I SAM-dependent methyltransferase n=1 Tax=Solibacillus sp. FSL H8-0538 TaxID=2921400 RepID=UPI0030FCF7C3